MFCYVSMVHVLQVSSATLAPGYSQQLLFGLGARLRLPAAGNFVSFLFVGLPAGSYLAYGGAHMRTHGLWAGLLLAMALIISVQYAYLYLTTDWDAAAKQARARALEKDKPSERAAAEGEGRGLAGADSAADSTVATPAEPAAESL